MCSYCYVLDDKIVVGKWPEIKSAMAYAELGYALFCVLLLFVSVL
jgi:hypothetical protein